MLEKVVSELLTSNPRPAPDRVGVVGHTNEGEVSSAWLHISEVAGPKLKHN